MSLLKSLLLSATFFLPTPVLAFSLTSTIKNPLIASGGHLESAGSLYSRLAIMMTTLTGIIFLVMVIYAGFLILTSQGKDEQIEKGKQILIWCAIGMIVIASAYIIVNFYVTTANSGALVNGQ